MFIGSSVGVGELVAKCRIGIAAKEKLKKVIEWLQRAASTFCSIQRHCHQVFSVWPQFSDTAWPCCYLCHIFSSFSLVMNESMYLLVSNFCCKVDFDFSDETFLSIVVDIGLRSLVLYFDYLIFWYCPFQLSSPALVLYHLLVI